MSIMKLSALLAVVAVAACSKTEPARTDTAAMTPAMAPATPVAMGSMSGDGMAMNRAHSDSIAAHAQTRLDSLRAASPDAAVKMVPEYTQAVNALLADCERMMKQMKMTPPAKWTTASAAVRADLVKMSTANASALHAIVTAHADRARGILDMRHDMMKM